MLEAANDTVESPLIDAMNVPRGCIEEKLPDDVLTAHYIDGLEFDRTLTYPRYWHGYLVPIKILLVFLNLEEIFKLNGIVITGLIILMAIMLYRNDPKKYVLASGFMGFVTLMNPFTISKSFQLADIFYITIITMLVMLYMYERKCDEKKMLFLFFFDGIAVAFFDFLTYPLVAFSVPMILYLYLYKKNVRDSLFTSIEYGLAWLFAYGGMWMSKFCLTALFTDEKIFADAATQVSLHTTATGEWGGDKITVLSALLRNFRIGASLPMLAMYLFIIVLMIILLNKNRLSIAGAANNIVIALLTISPVAWYIIMSHHSYLHCYMTYRELGILIFGIIILIGNSINVRRTS
jgi:hypothetical protein